MYQRVMLPVNLQDGPQSDRALEAALHYATNDGSHLYVVDVLPGYGMPLVASYFPPEARKAAYRETEVLLENYVREHVTAGVKVTAVVCEGRPYQQILEEARKHKVDLIVIPSQHFGSLDGFLLGSTAAKVVRHAHCSVLVVRG